MGGICGWEVHWAGGLEGGAHTEHRKDMWLWVGAEGASLHAWSALRTGDLVVAAEMERRWQMAQGCSQGESDF